MKKQIAVGCAIVAVVFGTLVFLAFGQNHTKTVTETKTVTQTVTKVKRVNAAFSTPQSLAAFLHPNTAQQVKCPSFVPKGSVCFQFGGNNFFVFLAMPASAAS